MAETKKTTNKVANKKPTVKRKKKKLSSPNGIAHIHSTINNTIITITDQQGNTLGWSSAGVIGYKGSKKSTPYAAGLAAEAVAKNVMAMGLKAVEVHVNGTGQGKDTAIRSLAAAGLQITALAEATPIPHNGCKPQKKPR